MCRKTMLVVCLMVVLSIVTQVLAANDWTNTTGDGKWSTAANWTEGVVPTATQDTFGDPRINLTGANACTIDGTMPQAVAQWLHIGNFWGETGTLNVVAGGKIGTPIWGPGWTYVGGENTSATGILNIDGVGSVMQSEGWCIGSAATFGSGTVNITNGGKMLGVWWGTSIRATGRVNISSGGVMQITGVGDFVIDAGGVIDINGLTAKLMLKTDRRPLVNALIAAGRITGNGIAGNVTVAYVPAYDYTYVTATQGLAAYAWANTTADGKWSTAANWSKGVVPTVTPDSNGDARINLTGANACTIDGTQPQAVAQWLHIGNFWGETGTLNVVAGGKIGTPLWGPGEIWVGGEDTDAIGILNIDGAGSVVQSEGWRIGSATLGSGTVNITNGGNMIGVSWNNYIENTGRVNLIDGTMYMFTLDIYSGGFIDIHPGSTLILIGNQTDKANGFIDSGKIRGGGVIGDIVATFDGNNTNVVYQVNPTVWVNTTMDGKWSTAANWNTGAVPVMEPNLSGMAKIYGSGSNACVIDGTQPQAVCQWLYVGYAAPGTLNVVSGGKIGTPLWGPGEIFLGTGYGVGVINIDGAGSVVQSEGWRIGGSATLGSGTVNITNGGNMIGVSWNNYIENTGRVNLIDGTMYMFTLDIYSGGFIDIHPGSTLILIGNQIDKANGFIASGKIRGGGIIGAVAVTFDGNNTLVVCQRDLASQQLMSLRKGVVFDRPFHQIPVEGAAEIHPADVNLVKLMGLDFAKVLINPELMMNAADGTINTTNIWYVYELVNKFLNHGIPVVVCIHPEPGFKEYYLGTSEGFTKLLVFYHDFAAYLAARWGRGEVAFELMTEPHENYQSWNTMLPQMWQAARSGMQDNILILDADGWSDIGHLVLLNPVADANVYYSFTTYWPWVFTFQGGYFNGSFYPYLSNVPYPSSTSNNPADYILGDIPEGGYATAYNEVNTYCDTPWNKSQQQALFAPITAWNNSHGGNLKVFCAEWGVFDANQARRVLGNGSGSVPADRIRFIKDRREALEAANISWAYWSFNEPFTILDPSVRVPYGADPNTSWISVDTMCALGIYGVTIIESGGSTDVNEQGTTTDTYTIVLNKQPTANVNITVDPDPDTQVNNNGAGNSIVLTFTSGNWDSAQTVTVKAIDDAYVEGNHTSTITHTAAGSDPDFNGISINDVVAHVTDNDVLFSDGFESNFDKWTDGGTTDWDRATSQKKTGSYSAHAGSADNDLISDNLNTAGYSSMTISLWFRDDDIDNDDDAYLQFYDSGSVYDNYYELGNSTEDTWNFYTVTIYNTGGDAQYFHSNFRLKFEGTSLDSGENLWIDDVSVVVY